MLWVLKEPPGSCIEPVNGGSISQRREIPKDQCSCLRSESRTWTVAEVSRLSGPELEMSVGLGGGGFLGRPLNYPAQQFPVRNGGYEFDDSKCNKDWNP